MCFLVVFDGTKWHVTRLIDPVIRDVYFSLGFAAPGDPTEIARAFINGRMSETMAFQSQPPSGRPFAGLIVGDVLLGAATMGDSAEGVAVSDVVMWKRALLSIEGHRFPGYTCEFVGPKIIVYELDFSIMGTDVARK